MWTYTTSIMGIDVLGHLPKERAPSLVLSIRGPRRDMVNGRPSTIRLPLPLRSF